jgi:hypothetical protein
MADHFDKGWIKRRMQELQAGGASRNYARSYAKAEAKGRARVARMTGNPAAAAGVIAIRHGRPVLLLDPGLIPPIRREAVRQFLFGPPGTPQ